MSSGNSFLAISWYAHVAQKVTAPLCVSNPRTGTILFPLGVPKGPWPGVYRLKLTALFRSPRSEGCNPTYKTIKEDSTPEPTK